MPEFPDDPSLAADAAGRDYATAKNDVIGVVFARIFAAGRRR